MFVAGAGELAVHKQMVDAMNVFPVPDGDTGTNMSLTVLAAAKEAEKNENATIGEVGKAIASGALRGARGNSGVIVSQIFRGFAKGLEGKTEATSADLAIAFEEAVKTAYKAVMKPKEGTILTIAKACSKEAVRLAKETDDVEALFAGAIRYGHEVLLQTPEMLPVLKQAGVVDAGGRGLLFIYEGMLKYLRGEEISTVPQEAIALTVNTDFSALSSIDHADITFGYCTEFFINTKNATDEVVEDLTSYLDSIGDSVVCIADEDIIKIHVHTDNPGLALEKALKIGGLSGMKIDNMREQHTAITDGVAPQETAKNQPKKDVGFVSISAGAGFSEIFRSLGVDIILEGGQTMNPSTDDILNAVDRINADSIILLPNNKNIILAAEQAIKLCEDKKMYVIPTRTVPEGITAMFCNGEDVSAEDMVAEMKEVIVPVNTVSMTYAVRDTMIDDKEIVSGDILGMVNDSISVVGKEIQSATKDTLASIMTEDSELVAIYFGSEATKEQAEEISEYIEENYPEAEVEIHKGEQPLYFYIISVE
ncbi:MAG: DAK2 domain-containing protein [Bacillota bacterium]